MAQVSWEGSAWCFAGSPWPMRTTLVSLAADPDLMRFGALRRPVLAVADRASGIAPIGMQLVKYVLHLLSNAGWPTRGAGCPHRDRRGSGAGSPSWRWSPDRSPQRSRGHRCQQDNGQRNVRRHHVLHNVLPPLWTAVAAVLPCRLDRPARRLRRYGQRRRTASAPQMNHHRPHTPCGARAGCSPESHRCSPTEPGWLGTSRPAGHGPAPWPGPHLDPEGRPAGPPSTRARAGSSACLRGCASSPGQPPSREAGHGRSRLSSQGLLRGRRR